jgi:hypothetical protein
VFLAGCSSGGNAEGDEALMGAPRGSTSISASRSSINLSCHVAELSLCWALWSWDEQENVQTLPATVRPTMPQALELSMTWQSKTCL